MVTKERLVAWGGALLLGMAGATAVQMYQRHNLQHWQVEQSLLKQDQINREFAQAINALAQRK